MQTQPIPIINEPSAFQAIEHSPYLSTPTIFRQWYNDYSDTPIVKLGESGHRYLIHDLTLAKTILDDTTAFQQRMPPQTDIFTTLFGVGLISTPADDYWQTTRRCFLKEIQIPKIEAKQCAFDEALDNLCDQLKTNQPVDIYPLCMRYTFHLMTEILLGAHDADLFEEWHRLTDIVNEERAKLVLNPLAIALPDSWHALKQKLDQTLMRQQDNPLDGYTVLLSAFDTLATILTWSLYELARHPEHLDTLRTTTDPEFAKKIFKEALRLYPVFPLYPRTNLQPLDYAGVSLPAHSEILINAIGLSHHASWDNPTQFNPHRHEKLNDPNNAFLGFGFGRRSCVGQVYAMHIAAHTLTRLAQDFDWTLAQPVTPAFQGILRPADGVWLRFV